MRSQSGSAIALSKHLRITCNVFHQNDTILALQIVEISLILILAYFPPRTDLETIDQAITKVFQCCRGKAPTILTAVTSIADSTQRKEATLFANF